MLILFQILFVLFSLFAITRVIVQRKSGSLGPKGTVFWIIFWLATILVVLWPNSVSVLANYLGIGRGADLVLYASLALIFYILFKLNIKIENMNRDVTKVVRSKTLQHMSTPAHEHSSTRAHDN